GSELYATNQAVDAIGTVANAGWNLTTSATGSGVANGTSVTNVAPGATATITADNNIITTQNGTEVAIGLNPVLTGLTSIKITNGPVISSTGIDMGNTTITNLAPGTNPTDAVNLSQLNSTVAGAQTHYYSVNDGGTQGGNYANDGATGADSLAAGVGASAAGDNSVALGFNAVASNTGDVALGSGSITAAANPTTGVTINGNTYVFAGGTPASVVSVGSAGNERQMTNVAAGQLNGNSTDAVNGSQLYATNQAVNSLGQQVDTNTTNIGNLQNQINNINQGGSGEFQTSADSTGSPSPTGTNSAAGGANANASGNDSLALGNSSTASGNQSTAVGTSSTASGTGSTAIGEGAQATGDNTVAVGSAGNERKITNVAAGTASTDAVNVSQLKQAQAGGVQYDTHSDGSTDYNSITLNPGGDSPTVIHNVGTGTANTDAVNVGQMNTAIAGAVTSANN